MLVYNRQAHTQHPPQYLILWPANPLIIISLKVLIVENNVILLFPDFENFCVLYSGELVK